MWEEWWGPITSFFLSFTWNMTGTSGDGTPPPRGDNRLLIHAITTQMWRMLAEHTEELYGRIEQLENQGNGDDGGDRRRRWRNNEGDTYIIFYVFLEHHFLS